MATSNPNYKTDSTMDFFNFMKGYYSEQSTEKTLKTIDKRLSTSEGDISNLREDVTIVKKDVKIIKDSIEDLSANQKGILSSIAELAAAYGVGRGLKPIPTPGPPRSGPAASPAPRTLPAPPTPPGPPPASPSAPSGRPSIRTAAQAPLTRPNVPAVRGFGIAAAAIAATTVAVPFIQSMMGRRQAGEPNRILGGISVPDFETNDYSTAVKKASEQTGVPMQLLASIGEIESSSGANMKNPMSSATGAFQFIDSTWAEMLQKHGKEKGIDVEGLSLEDIMKNKELMDLRYNHEMSAYMGAKFLQMNAKTLKIDPSDPSAAGKMYLAHFLGGGGANKVISGENLEREYMRKVIQQNKNVFTDNQGKQKLDFDNPDQEAFRTIVMKFADSKMKKASQSQNVKSIVEAGSNDTTGLSLDTDAILAADELGPQRFRPEYTKSDEKGTGRRELQMPKTGASVTSIGPQEQKLDPNRQNIFGPDKEPKFNVKEVNRPSADVVNLEEYRQQKTQPPVSSLTKPPESKQTTPTLTSKGEERSPISTDDSVKAVALKAMGVLGRVSGALTAAEVFKEVTDMYVDRSTAASVEQNLRQMGTQIPGPEGGVNYDYTPDQMQQYAARRTAELTKLAINESKTSAQSAAQNVSRSLEESAEVNQNVVIMQPIVMPERVIERNTPVPASTAEPGVPPVLPPPSSVDNFNFGYAAP